MANTFLFPFFEKKPKPVIHQRTWKRNLILFGFCGAIRVCFCFLFSRKNLLFYLMEGRKKKSLWGKKVFISSGGVYKAVIASLPRILFFFWLLIHQRKKKKSCLIQMSHVQFWKNTSGGCQRGSGLCKCVGQRSRLSVELRCLLTHSWLEFSCPQIKYWPVTNNI